MTLIYIEVHVTNLPSIGMRMQGALDAGISVSFRSITSSLFVECRVNEFNLEQVVVMDRISKLHMSHPGTA